MKSKNLLFAHERRALRSLTAVIAVAGALATESCAGSKTVTNYVSSEQLTTLTFDDLGGGSTIIQVYPGVENTPANKIDNGTYNTGDVVNAICQTTGRTVRSDPTNGEIKRQSNVWVEIHGDTGPPQYASTVYVYNPERLLDQLKDC